MPRPPSRRDFLALSMVGLGAGAGCDREKSSVTCTVRTDQRFQTMEGLGTSLIGWVVKLYRTPCHSEFYSKELGATVVRVELSSGAVPEVERWQDITAQTFDLDGPGQRAANYLRSAQALTRASGNTLRVIGTVWSPPGWMKHNGLGNNGNKQRKNFSLSPEEVAEPLSASAQRRISQDDFLHSNKLRHDRYQHFAKSLVEWVRLYRAHDIDLYGLGPQNEPRFSHWFGSAVYSAAELARLIEAIDDIFRREHETLPRLFAPETMTHDDAVNRIYLEALFSGARPGQHVHALASHGYVDGYRSDDAPESAARFYQLAKRYQKRVWMTEGATGGHDWPEPLHQLGSSLLNSLVAGHASLVTPWQFLSEEPDTHALMPVSGPTKKTFVAVHFFRFIRPEMTRVAAEVTGSERVSAGAFVDAKRSVVVLLNRSSERKHIICAFPGRPSQLRECYVTDRRHNLRTLSGTQLSRIELPGESIATLVFE